MLQHEIPRKAEYAVEQSLEWSILYKDSQLIYSIYTHLAFLSLSNAEIIFLSSLFTLYRHTFID